MCVTIVFSQFRFFRNGGPFFSSSGRTRLQSLPPRSDSSVVHIAVAKQDKQQTLLSRPSARQSAVVVVVVVVVVVDRTGDDDAREPDLSPRPLLLSPSRRGLAFVVAFAAVSIDDSRGPLVPELAPAVDAGGLVGLRGRGARRALVLARRLCRAASVVEGALALGRFSHAAPADPDGEARGRRPAGDGPDCRK